MKYALMIGIAGLALAACSQETATPTAAPDETVTGAGDAAVETATVAASAVTMETVLAGAWRSEKNKARDTYRHPAETLAFSRFQLMRPLWEIAPGGGWYTEVIAPYLAGGGGTYYAATSGDAERDAKFKEKFADAETFGAINVGVLGQESIPAGSVDTVLTFRNIHNWMSGGSEAQVFANAFAALKPGGVFGVVEHRLPSSAEQDPEGGTGYVHEDYAIGLAKAAGFEFAASSEVNANSKDTADHPFGVWTLAPARYWSRDGVELPEGFDPAKYEAIGESDRFTLKFVKPLDATAAAAPVTSEPVSAPQGS